MTTEKTKILILGATGYVGGSVLTELIDCGLADKHEISALVRQPYHCSILKDQGINPILFKDLDDFEGIEEAAKDHDIVIAAASARHAESARACISGLARRRKSTGRTTHYIHTSGASMIGNWPITKDPEIATKTYSDKHDKIFEIEKDWLEDKSPVRKVNQLVVELGDKEGVKTYIIAPPLIYGPGTGFFTLGFGQVHMVVQLSLEKKQPVTVGAGEGVWSRIHIKDLTTLYYLLTQAIIDEKSALPTNTTGYYFAENGCQSWKHIAEEIGISAKELEVLEKYEVLEVGLQEAADVFYEGNLVDAEAVLASNAVIAADNAREILGWKPARGEEYFYEEIIDVVHNMASEKEVEKS